MRPQAICRPPIPRHAGLGGGKGSSRAHLSAFPLKSERLAAKLSTVLHSGAGRNHAATPSKLLSPAVGTAPSAAAKVAAEEEPKSHRPAGPSRATASGAAGAGPAPVGGTKTAAVADGGGNRWGGGSSAGGEPSRERKGAPVALAQAAIGEDGLRDEDVGTHGVQPAPRLVSGFSRRAARLGHSSPCGDEGQGPGPGAGATGLNDVINSCRELDRA